MVQPQENEKNPVRYESKLSDLASFNAFGVVTLSDGQRVNTQLTMRHGIPLEKLYEDFQKWVAFLDKCATDSSVKFWEGKEGKESKAEEQNKTYAEPTYTQMDDSGAEVHTFPAGTLTVEWKNKKPYYQVTDASSKVTKFPVRLWPEVLEKSGIKPEDVDVVAGKELTGWTAFYEPKEDSKWPAKVTLLKQPDFV